MLPLFLEVAAVAGTVAVLIFQGTALWLARQMPSLEPRPPSDGEASDEMVSVVVAARNEEHDLGPTLDGLLAQDYPHLEIVVVEGGSSDGTRDAALRRAPRVRIVDEPPLPDGWVGKNWACWTGARATSGRWLLFLDADVRLHPAAVRTVLAWARTERAAVATIAPRVEMVGFWERTVLPFYVQMVLTYFRAPRVNRDGSRTAMANGQFWLVPRADYEELGGHEAVRGTVLEDVALARRFRAAGKRIRLAWAPALATTRMYRDRHEMFEGILKNIHGTEFSVGRQLGFLGGLLAAFWLPLAVLPVGLWLASPLLIGLGALLVVALFGKHVALAHAVGAPAWYGLTFPIAVGFYAVALATSIARGLRQGTVAWKGRAYPMQQARTPKG